MSLNQIFSRINILERAEAALERFAERREDLLASLDMASLSSDDRSTIAIQDEQISLNHAELHVELFHQHQRLDILSSWNDPMHCQIW